MEILSLENVIQILLIAHLVILLMLLLICVSFLKTAKQLELITLLKILQKHVFRNVLPQIMVILKIGFVIPPAIKHLMGRILLANVKQVVYLTILMLKIKTIYV